MRPKPTILLEFNRGYRIEQVVEAQTITALTYLGRPVNYRVVDTLTGRITYPTTSSPNPAFIRRLAADLNTLHDTTAFEAREMK